jgi:hypothetical protein
VKSTFDELYKWYIMTYPIETFFNRHEINLEGLDDGAKYFALMDIIIKECQTNELDAEEKMVNTVAEHVYGQL